MAAVNYMCNGQGAESVYAIVFSFLSSLTAQLTCENCGRHTTVATVQLLARPHARNILKEE